MRLVAEVNSQDIPHILAAFLRLANEQLWGNRLRWIERQLRRNPLLAHYMEANHSLELTMPKLRHKAKIFGRNISLEDEAEYRLAAFMAGVVSIHEALPDKARGRLRGALKDGLTDPDKKGLISLQHEITVGIHLMDQGFDVSYADWEGTGQFDFLASRGGKEIEVECKVITADLGRKITTLQAVEIFDRIVRNLGPGHKTTQGTIVQITLPGRLERNEKIKNTIAGTAARAIKGGSPLHERDVCTVDISHFDHMHEDFGHRPGRPFDMEAVRRFYVDKTGHDNPQLFVYSPPQNAPLFISVQSARPDAVLESIFETLSQAAKSQLSKKRPGVFCVQLHDLAEDQLVELAQGDSTDPAKATGLKLATHHFLTADSRAHVLSVAFRAHGKVLQRALSSTDLGGIGARETGIAYAIGNNRHACYGDPAYRLFSPEAPARLTPPTSPITGEQTPTALPASPG